MKPTISLVTPCYNEQDIVADFYGAVTPVMQSLNEEYEIIFVNDGSKDNTLDRLSELADKDKHVKVISFSRNFSQQNAIYCGLKYASGQAVIVMDVDLQDPVEVIPAMVSKWREGYEVINGKRTKRKGETVFKKFTSWLYIRIMRKMTGLDVPTEVGDYKLYDRKVIDAILSLPEHNRFMRNMSVWTGFKQTNVEFERNARTKGETKYTLTKMVKLSVSSILPYTSRPLLWSLWLGFTLSTLSELAFVALIVLQCTIGLPLVTWLFPTITLIGGMILTHMGIANMYSAHIYEEVLDRPQYIVSSTINIDEKH